MPDTTNTTAQSARPKRRWMALGGIALALVIAGVILYPLARQRWTAPLGPALNLPTYTPTQPQSAAAQATLPVTLAVTQELASTEESVSEKSPTPSPKATLQPTPTSQPLCGGPPTMVVLAVGVDTEDDDYRYGLGDAIRVVRVDFVTPKVSVLSIPRDLWVEIPGISDHYGITHGKLNQAYLYGSPGMGYYDEEGEGPGLMARTLDLNFGLRVDHYGALNMITFVRIVDAVGGVDIYLPTDIDGTPIDDQTADMGYFTAGQNHFDGDAALRFSRIRKRYNDLTRMDHQNMVLCALREKLLSPSVLPKIPEIIAAFQDSVITDLSLEQLSQLACLLPKLERENLIFASLPDEIFSPSRVYSPQMRNETFIMEADFDVIREYVRQFLAGEWPVSEPGGEPTCPE